MIRYCRWFHLTPVAHWIVIKDHRTPTSVPCVVPSFSTSSPSTTVLMFCDPSVLLTEPAVTKLLTAWVTTGSLYSFRHLIAFFYNVYKCVATLCSCNHISDTGVLCPTTATDRNHICYRTVSSLYYTSDIDQSSYP